MKQRIAFIHIIMFVTIDIIISKNYSESPVTHPSLMSQPVFFLEWSEGGGVREKTVWVNLPAFRDICWNAARANQIAVVT